MARNLVLALTLAAPGPIRAASQAAFGSPQEAAAALLDAVECNDLSRFLTIAGTGMASFWNSGDPERDTFERERLLEAARRAGIRIVRSTADRGEVYLGDFGQAFPAPLVKTASGWRFDGDAGAQRVAARRIKRNETAIVEMCRRFREAEFEYMALSPEGNAAFADRIRSIPGQRDGLFWSGARDEGESPLGPSFAAAAVLELQPGERARPMFGYYVKILGGQGAEAPGGAIDYHSAGRLRRGFALIAWPAEYAVGGIHSFLINHFGDVYRNDLGPDTGRIAEALSAFNPDPGWTKVEIHDE